MVVVAHGELVGERLEQRHVALLHVEDRHGLAGVAGDLRRLVSGEVAKVVVIADCRSCRQPVGLPCETCSLSMAQSIC